jgi:hypothetical protein
MLVFSEEKAERIKVEEAAREAEEENLRVEAAVEAARKIMKRQRIETAKRAAVERWHTEKFMPRCWLNDGERRSWIVNHLHRRNLAPPGRKALPRRRSASFAGQWASRRTMLAHNVGIMRREQRGVWPLGTQKVSDKILGGVRGRKSGLRQESTAGDPEDNRTAAAGVDSLSATEEPGAKFVQVKSRDRRRPLARW